MAGIDAYTKLILHLDNDVTDSELIPKTVTNNNVTFSDTVKKFGYSGVFNGTNSYLEVPDSDDFNFGTNPFTIDFWVRFNSDPSLLNPFLIHQANSDEERAFVINYVNSTGLGYGLEFLATDYAWNIGLRCPWIPTLNTWYHIAVVRVNNNNSSDGWRLFIDGIGQTWILWVGSWGATIPNVDGTLQIGKRHQYNGWYHNGYMDEIRISKGIARWTSNFTIPTVPYSRDRKSINKAIIIA
jgi:hypothetical protein